MYSQVRRFSVHEYYAMAEAGILNPDERLELIDGQIVRMSPQNPPHASTTARTADYLREILRGKAQIRSQLPVRLHVRSEPEPDVAVVRIDRQGYANEHPSPADIFWLIEVSDATLRFDLSRKKAEYARAGIAEYWTIDLKLEQLRVFRHPRGASYQEESILDKSAIVNPLAFPEVKIHVSRFFLPEDI